MESEPKRSATIIAYCWAGGLIQFGPSVPDGAIGIARGEEAKVRDVIEVTARHAKDNERLLVPGVPEAANEREGLAALARYIQWLGERNGPGFRAMGA
ncbi:host nuclease inhibitor protein [Pseudomonas sp. MDMC224]|nr:host nuclease inhibitor protein [Pseudomonas sp. MDMC224]